LEFQKNIFNLSNDFNKIEEIVEVIEKVEKHATSTEVSDIEFDVSKEIRI